MAGINIHQEAITDDITTNRTSVITLKHILMHMFLCEIFDNVFVSSSEPTICRNEYDYPSFELFVCPGENQDDNLDHCCGPDDRQKCCKGPKEL